MLNQEWVPRGDLLEIEATAATQQQQIVNSENNLRLSKIALAQLLLISDYENFDIADDDYEIQPSQVLDNSPRTIFEKAVSFRNDIKFSEANVGIGRNRFKIGQGNAIPRDYRDFIITTPGPLIKISWQVSRSTQTTRRRPIGLVEGTDQVVVGPNTRPIIEAMDPFIFQLGVNDGHSFGAALNIPILNGFSAKNSVKRNKVNLERAKLQLEQDKLDLENVINQAWNDAKAAITAHEAAQKTLEARQLAYDYSKERFDVGLMNAFDFSQAQSRLDNAQAEVIPHQVRLYL